MKGKRLLKIFSMTAWLVAGALTPHPLAGQTSARQDSTSPAIQSRKTVVLTVTVLNDKNGYVWDLDKSLFTVYDGEAAQEITLFKAEDTPFSMGILIETSHYMRMGDSRSGLDIGLVPEGLSSFLNQTHRDSEYFLMSFNERPQLLVDWTSDKRALLEKLQPPAKLTGGADFSAVCAQGLEKLKTAKYQKRVLLVIGGGSMMDDDKYKELRHRLPEEGTLFYAVGFKDSSTGPLFASWREGVLRELSADSGGLALFPKNPKQLKQSFDLLAVELSHQYTIGFAPGDTLADGKWHKLKVKVSPPRGAAPGMKSLRARSRAGYQAES